MTHYSPKAQMFADAAGAADVVLNSPRTLAAAPLRAALVLAVMTALAGAPTPVLKPSVDVPAQFAAPQDSVDEPEVAWWESFEDPVLSDLIRRAARENRDVKIAAERVRAARAGETISRSWLFPSVGVGGAGFDHNTGLRLGSIKQRVPEAANTKRRQAASMSPGKSTSPVACAPVPLRPPPTRWRSKTAREACACW